MTIVERCKHLVELVQCLPKHITCSVMSAEERDRYINGKYRLWDRTETSRMEDVRGFLLTTLEELESDYGDNFLDVCASASQVSEEM